MDIAKYHVGSKNFAPNVVKDWGDFVNAVAADLVAGLSTLHLSQKYGGTEVQWAGKVREIKTADEFAPGIQMDMPRVVIDIGGNRFLTSDYVFLNVSESKKELWGGVHKGQEIGFFAKIKSAGGVFPSIDIETFPNSPKSILSVALDDAIPSAA